MAKKLKATVQGPIQGARVIGANSIALFGRFAIDSPGGVFLGAHHSKYELAYYLVLLLYSLVCAGGYYKRQAWANTASLFLLSFNCGVFLPALTSDPIKAAGIIGWQLFVMLMLIFAVRPTLAEARIDESLSSEASEGLRKWLSKHRHAMQHITMITALESIAILGFEIGDNQTAKMLLIFMNLLTVVYMAPLLHMAWKSGRKNSVIPLLPLAIALLFSWLAIDALVITFMLAFHLSLFFLLFSYSPVLSDLLYKFSRSPALFVLVSFFALISIGALFLSFPLAGKEGVALTSIEAVFTSVSAVCVTGLSVIDVSQRLSFFGQFLLLILMQLGGLGIMVLSTFATILVGGRLGLRTEQILGDTLGASGARTAYRLVVFIVLTTLILEGIGALLLTFEYLELGLSLPNSIWHGLFHAVSAFCNAGFSLHSDSLMGMAEKPFFLSIVMVLITLGGLGFVVLLSLARLAFPGARRNTVPIQVKIVLHMSLILLVTAFLGILAVEWDASLAHLSWPHKLTNALFQSVTLRTAGFNTIDFGLLQSASIGLMLLFMFIGAAPGGTGGGIKVTTAALVLAAFPALVNQRQQAVLYKRRIPGITMLKAMAVVSITLTGTVVLLWLLLWTQNLPFEKTVFEIFSAIGTVGLSLGITDQLTDLGQCLIIAAMFLGRVGPLTAALAFAQERKSRVKLPEEPLMVG